MPNDYTPAKPGKWLQKMLDDQTPRILVESGKYAQSYYWATASALLPACLAVLKGRFESGYIPTVEQAEASIVKAQAEQQAAFTQEHIDKMLPGKVRDFAMRELESMTRHLDHCLDAAKQARRAALAMQNNDGVLAYYVIQERGDYEYEKFSVEAIIMPE